MDFVPLPLVETLSRLGLAFLIGALLGLERERHHRPAGLRTHILVTLASALFAMVSIVAAGPNNDPGRIAAQVVTGIGFLGAGTIMRNGSSIVGLTTAASLWMSAALGLAIGFGWVVAGAVTAAMAFIALNLLHYVEEAISPRAILALVVTAEPGSDPVSLVLERARSLGAVVNHVHFAPLGVTDSLQFTIDLAAPPGLSTDAVASTLRTTPGVRDVDPAQ